MIAQVIDYLLQEWKVVLTTAVLLLVAGVYSLSKLDIEAYPDPAPPIIEVIAQNSSWSAEEMEQQITVPLETELNGMPGLEHMRSVSLFGLTDIKCYFAYSTSYWANRQEVLNRLQMVQLPAGVQPQLSPESTIGEIYRYQLVGSNYTVRELKETEDWLIERYFKQVPGVIDVVSFGGATKVYQVDLDPRQLVKYRLSVPQVQSALANGNSNVGANYLAVGEQSYNVRGIGLYKDLKDIENSVVAERNGVPIYIKQLGTVSLGRKVPLGRVGRDEAEDIVQGIVLMRPGEQSLPVLAAVKRQVERLNADILPSGMRIVPYCDRTDLVNLTTHTVKHTLTLGMVLVAFILLAFLGDLKAALIGALTIPLSLCFVIIVMVARGDSANLISMGAIDFGIIVDASVVMVENIYRHLCRKDSYLQNVRLITSEAAKEVSSPIFFSTMVICVSFLPLFTMQGVEGKIFGPMALTYGLALLAALVLAFSFAPVASSLLLRRRQGHEDTWLVSWLRRPYTRILRGAVSYPWMTIALAVVVLVGTVLLLPRVGGEFMPKLEEGNLWVRATMPLSISYDAASRVTNQVRAIMREFPEVTTVVSQLGRPDDGTDATSYFNAEFFVNLQPRERWPGHISKESLVTSMDERLHKSFPAVDFNFSQNIEDNVEEAMSGVKGENSVKIFGSDLATLESLAEQTRQVMEKVPGIKDLGVFHLMGQPNLIVRTNREAAARYGLQVADVNGLVNAAIGGTAATQVLQGDRRFDVVVRLQRPFRDSAEAIARIPIMTPDGASIPLSQVADVEFKAGAGYIYREDNARYIPIKFSVVGRDLESTIAEADGKIKQQAKFPRGYYRIWSGEFQELQDAVARLKIIVPLSLLLILFILNKMFNSLVDACMILITVPLASTGGVLSLLLTHTTFSVSAAVGFISLFGVCVWEGVLLVTRIKTHLLEGMSPYDAIVEGGELLMRPVLMVALSAAIGLLPAALATGIGSETQRPLARVVVGGMMTSIVVILLVLPALYRVIHRPRK